MFKETKDGLILTLRISPNARKNEIIKTDDMIKIKIMALPIDNKANKATINFLATFLNIPKSALCIVKGETSREKTVLIKVFDKEKIEKIKTLL